MRLLSLFKPREVLFLVSSKLVLEVPHLLEIGSELLLILRFKLLVERDEILDLISLQSVVIAKLAQLRLVLDLQLDELIIVRLELFIENYLIVQICLLLGKLLLHLPKLAIH